VFPSDGSEPMVLNACRMMARFLVHRLLFLEQFPLPRELQLLIGHQVYWGQVSDVITNVRVGGVCVRKGTGEFVREKGLIKW
jgi:hypothetical protein